MNWTLGPGFGRPATSNAYQIPQDDISAVRLASALVPSYGFESSQTIQLMTLTILDCRYGPCS